MWSKRNIARVIGFCLTLAFILQAHAFLATNQQYASGFGGCSYGFIGNFNIDTVSEREFRADYPIGELVRADKTKGSEHTSLRIQILSLQS